MEIYCQLEIFQDITAYLGSIFVYVPCRKAHSCEHQGLADVKLHCCSQDWHQSNLISWKNSQNYPFKVLPPWILMMKMLQVCDVSIENLCIDLFYCFDKSSKRKGKLAEYFEFCDQDYKYFKACICRLAFFGTLYGQNSTQATQLESILFISREF